MDKRIIVIGDVHGCLEELKALLVECGHNPTQDKVIVAGDLVDRGPDSAGVVAFVRESGFECVMGNHDDKHVRMFHHMSLKRANPNYRIPMRAFGTDKLSVFNALTDEDFDWLGKLPYFIRLPDNWIVVHAGLIPGKLLENQDVGQLTHLRFLNKDSLRSVSLGDNYQQPKGSVYWTELYDLPYNVIYGHNVHSLAEARFERRPNGAKLVGIDTGACFGGMLTAFILPEQKFVQVKSRKAYSRSWVTGKDGE